MLQDYKEYECIRQMDENDKDRFKCAVNMYADRLNNVVSDNGTIYTFHDFDHHCCNLFKIVSDVILYRDVAFTGIGLAISKKELYLLNLAILLHDIGMTKHVDLNRDRHAVTSVEILKNEYKNESSPLTELKSGLSRNEFQALCMIILAHSDVKDGSVPEEENGMRNTRLTNEMTGRPRPIRARFLASILRMADELDITSDRLGAVDVYNELEKAAMKEVELEQRLANEKDKDVIEKLKEERGRYHNAVMSWEHWKRLSYFSAVRCNDQGVVELVVDDDTIAEEIASGIAEEKIVDAVLKVHDKIQKEFQSFQEETNASLEYSSMIAMKEIQLSSQTEKILNELKKRESFVTRQRVDEIDGLPMPHVISSELEKEITSFIENRGLFQVGHYLLMENICARDWISIEEIVTTESFFRKCERQLLLHIKSLGELNEHFLIIGVDFCGMLVASRLAMILHQPYDYLIPQYREGKLSQWEVNSAPPDSEVESIVIVMDVIVTFNTVKNLMDRYGIREKVKAVYAILYRRPSEDKLLETDKELVDKTYVLNSNFPIECRDNCDCMYKNTENCKASNKLFR